MKHLYDPHIDRVMENVELQAPSTPQVTRSACSQE
jgi:hypothetical protein